MSSKTVVIGTDFCYSKRQKNQGKQPVFCSGNCADPFADRGEYFGMKNPVCPNSGYAWSALLRNGLLIQRTVDLTANVQKKRKPSNGSQRKNAEARFSEPLN